jgi:hypothetical protein
VLSLQNLLRPGSGLGEHSAVITGGALATQATIDLANPVLADDPTVALLSGDRLTLTLPHGGLVHADGTTGALTGADLVVTVDADNRPVVTGTPTGKEVSADPLIGRLVFATPLAGTGQVIARYFLGTWEQRVVRLSGRLRVVVWGGTAAAATDLSASVIAALDRAPRSGLQGLQQFSLEELGTVASPSPTFPTARARALAFAFEFEEEVDVPESSGGLIQRIPIAAFVS